MNEVSTGDMKSLLASFTLAIGEFLVDRDEYETAQPAPPFDL